jgi:hypothetical protein
VENLVRKLKRGTDKYKGTLPLKCFNCDGIGHFSSKFPYAKNKGSDEEEYPKRNKKNQKGDKRRNKKRIFKKISTQRKTTLHQKRMMIVTMI